MTIKKLLTYTTVITTIVWSVGLFALPLSVGAAVSGDLIKLQCATGAGVNDACKAVYYLGGDGKRYVFPDEKTYKTWYSDFSGVMIVSSTEMSAYPIGGNVTYRPGVKMVKITTDPKVYAVSANGTLHWVTTEELAVALYGTAWATMVQDVSDAFFVNYTVGSDIDAAADYDRDAQTADATSVNVDKGLAGGGSSSGTGLTVALASDTPASMLAICTAIRVPFTKVNLTASADGDVIVDSLIVERAGIASDANLGSVAIIDANTNVQVGLNQNLNSSHRANFNNDITIPAGTTRSLILAGNMNPSTATDCTSGAGNVPALSLVSVTPKGNVAVIGSFPVTGNYQTINAVTIGQVTVQRGAFSNATSTTVKVGQLGYVFASYKISANSTENQKVKQLKLYNAGTASLSTDLENFKVYKGNVTQVPVTVTIDGKYITLDFSNNPIEIEKGKNEEFTVKADVVGGSTRTVKFVIYRTTDIIAQGTSYGQSRVAAYTGTGTGGTGEVLSDNQFTISQGTLRVDSNSTAVGSQNVAFGDGQVLGAWSFVVAGEPVQITQLVLANSSTTADSEQFDNVKLVDGNGTTLMGPSSSLTSGSVTFSETVELPVGTTVVKVVADMETQNSDEDFAAGATFYWQITPTSITATGANTNETITATPSAAVTAATQTFKGAVLAITRNALPVNGNVVLGQQDFKFGSWTFDTTASGEDIRVTVIKVGNRVATTTNVDNLTLYDMSKTSQSVCLADYPNASYDSYGCAIETEDGSSGTSTFTLSDPMVVTKNTQRIVELRGDVRTTAATYVGHKDEFMLFVTGTAGDVITARGVITNNTVTPTGTGVTGQTGAVTTIVAAGTLTVNTAASTNNSLVAANSTIELDRLKLTATNEDIDVEELALCVGDPSDTNGSETGDADDITEFKVYKATDMTNPLITGSVGSGNTCRTFTLVKGTLVVPKDSSAGVELVIKGTLADIGTGLPGLAGADVNVGIGGTDGIKGTGKASSTTVTDTYTASTSSLFKLVMGYPKVTLNTLPSSTGLSNGSIVADFTISNPSPNPIAIYRVSFAQVTSTDANIGVTKAKLVVQSDGSKTVGAEATCDTEATALSFRYQSATTSDCLDVDGSTVSYYAFVLQDEDDATRTRRAYRIGGNNGSARFQVVATEVTGADATADGQVAFYLSGDNATTSAPALIGVENVSHHYGALDQGNFVWSDLWTNDAWDSNSGNATASAQWWNGYLVEGLSSASSTQQVIKE
ncbi:MAG: hypothetical protein A2744_04095 [Candidatus Buchananbacteria bacterium RIFCSPHIGHO2_01_FULL_44_11]|uniref:Uncharacterized protein n=1 Tax=Candidatus Buchananbacteria bacterium RIFCSPHIGHO2_01_FULL_44_11 TaxID=1797535 RepID=A0A1G1Y3D5_9BACT|nr:MAG: hypothetical protein A2744_04095 [Candidatus Buchananbacteria bacterium RIFCSPHIGHO2_01_FULL_44_11]